MIHRVVIKAEQIARMVVKGLKGPQIAIEMGLSYDGLQRILRQPEYLKIEERVRAEVLGKMDARLAQRAQMSTEMEDTVPEAMRILIEQVTKKRDLKAALEVLDRDPRRQFAKSRPAVTDPDGNPKMAPDALSSAMKDADLTHQILQGQQAARISQQVDTAVPLAPNPKISDA